VQLDTTLRSLRGDAWALPAHDDHGTVRDLIVHLIGVERLALQWVTARAGSDLVPTDHMASTRATDDQLAAADVATLRRLWFGAARDLHAAAVVADPSKPVLAHDLPTDVDGLLVLRAFELWAHLHDICAAAGGRVPDVEDERMALMTARLMAALPMAVALRGHRITSRSVRFVVTGRAGGCFEVALGPVDVERTADVTIVADAVALCRVAARRLAAGDLDAHVEGDATLAHTVLGSLDAFARD
jgi:uncharacterized protein (TIGR03083 family)